MADILKKYEEVTDEVTAPTTASDRSTERLRRIEQHQKEILKRLKRLVKEQKKLRKRKEEIRKAEEEAAKKVAAEKANKRSRNDNGVWGFFGKLGDAICKAMPKVLTTLTTLAFGFFVKRKLKFSPKALFAT